MVELKLEEEDAARVATARNSRGKRERAPNKSRKTTPEHSPLKLNKQTSPARSLARAQARPPVKVQRGAKYK
jgi:hypothetical protein